MTNRNAEEAAWAELDRLTDGSPGKLWRWGIPANPERDSDLILAAGLKAVADERDAALALIADVRELGRAMEVHPRSHQYGVDIRYALTDKATK